MDEVEAKNNLKPTNLQDNAKGVEKGDSTHTASPEPATDTEFQTREADPVLEVPDYMSLQRANELQGLLNTWFPDYQVQVGKVEIVGRMGGEQVGIYLDGNHIGDVYPSGVRDYEHMIDATDFRSKAAQFIERTRPSQDITPATQPLTDLD